MFPKKGGNVGGRGSLINGSWGGALGRGREESSIEVSRTALSLLEPKAGNWAMQLGIVRKSGCELKSAKNFRK